MKLIIRCMALGLFASTFFLLFPSCKKKVAHETTRIPEKSDIIGLVKPILLNPDTTVLVTHDYFMTPENIQDIICDSGICVTLSDDKKEIMLISRGNAPILSVLRIVHDGNDYDILLKRSDKVRVKMQYKAGKKNPKSVQLAGDFNNWNPGLTNMAGKSGKKWEVEFLANPGRYQYQIVIDGKWQLDPANPDSVLNNNGNYNSLLTVGDIAAKYPHIRTLEPQAEEISLQSSDTIRNWYILWNNHLVADEDLVSKVGAKSIIFSFPEESKNHKRSWIRVFAHSKNQIANDILIPLEYGKPVMETSALSRKDTETNIIYFLMVDRFFDSNPSVSNSVNDKLVPPIADYMGGDLAGISAKIKDGYFEKLGTNAVWLTPIVQNPLIAYKEYIPPGRKFSGYHGYWPISSTRIDHRFGTDDDLHELVALCHKNNMNMYLDYVANHVHEDHPLIKENPNWKTPLRLPDGKLNVRIWDEQRLTTWFDTFLPSLDFSIDEVIESVSDSAVFWIKKFGVDGFRHDATKHIPEEFWRRLTRKLKEQVIIPENKTLYQIGETFGSRELIGSYVGSGMLDAQFDFNLYFDTRYIFAESEAGFDKLHESLLASLRYYGFQHLMGNITGNHDLPRFITFASGALSFGEDDKEAGWNREIAVKDPIGYKKLKSLMAFTLTIPGIPVIYYGDEIGMPGAGDPDNRRMMKFSGLTDAEASVKEITSKLCHFRKSRMEMLYGDIFFLEVSPDIFTYSRSYFGKHSIVIFNKNEKELCYRLNLPEWLGGQTFTSLFGTQVSVQDGNIQLNLPPHGFDVLFTTK